MGNSPTPANPTTSLSEVKSFASTVVLDHGNTYTGEENAERGT